MILFIRHAEKSLTGLQELTAAGLDDAYHYGKELKKQGIYFDEIISSPVKRCLQTAENIIKGLDSEHKVKLSHLLGDPGIFIEDDKKAAIVFEQLTVCEVINSQIKGKKLSGFLSIDKACQPLIKEIQKNINLNKSILYISHDAIIMPFIAYLTQIKLITESDIINYLNGYTIKKIDNKSPYLTAIPFGSK